MAVVAVVAADVFGDLEHAAAGVFLEVEEELFAVGADFLRHERRGALALVAIAAAAAGSAVTVSTAATATVSAFAVAAALITALIATAAAAARAVGPCVLVAALI